MLLFFVVTVMALCNWHYRRHTETKVEIVRTYSKNAGHQVDQTLHRVAAKEREEIKRMTKQKMT